MFVQHEMAIEADAQCHERCIDKLKYEVAADDVFGAFLEWPRHLDNIFQDDVRHHADEEANHSQHYQMCISLPLPIRHPERLEHCQCHYCKRSADNSRCYRFFASLFHTSRKDTKKRVKKQTISHIFTICRTLCCIFMLFIPVIRHK